MNTTHQCENCGKDQQNEYVAVEMSTPAAQWLSLNKPTEDGHHAVCEVCFNTAVKEIARTQDHNHKQDTEDSSSTVQ